MNTNINVELVRGEHQLFLKCETTLPGNLLEIQILFNNILKELETFQVILVYTNVWELIQRVTRAREDIWEVVQCCCQLFLLSLELYPTTSASLAPGDFQQKWHLFQLQDFALSLQMTHSTWRTSLFNGCVCSEVPFRKPLQWAGEGGVGEWGERGSPGCPIGLTKMRQGQTSAWRDQLKSFHKGRNEWNILLLLYQHIKTCAVKIHTLQGIASKKTLLWLISWASMKSWRKNKAHGHFSYSINIRHNVMCKL